MEKYTAEVSARKIVERIKHLLGQGVAIPLKKEWVIKGFGGTLWNLREAGAIDFDAGFDYLNRCRAIKTIEREAFELTEYFETLTPKYHAPPPFPIQIDRQIRNEAENMQHCYYWLYIFENTLRDFIQNSLSGKYGEDWYNELSQGVKREIELNKGKWHSGILPRNRLEFTTLDELHSIIRNKWGDGFKEKFENIDQASLIESLKRIEKFRNTIAHSRMLTEEESNTFYYEIKRVLSSIKIFRK